MKLYYIPFFLVCQGKNLARSPFHGSDIPWKNLLIMRPLQNIAEIVIRELSPLYLPGPVTSIESLFPLPTRRPLESRVSFVFGLNVPLTRPVTSCASILPLLSCLIVPICRPLLSLSTLPAMTSPICFIAQFIESGPWCGLNFTKILFIIFAHTAF